MLREMGRGFNGPELDNFIAAVRRRLEALEERGIQVTRNHVRAAGTCRTGAVTIFAQAKWS
jgi:hypothetical protein